MKCWLFLIFFVAHTVHAVGLGIKEVGLNKSLLISDYATFSPAKKDFFGLTRYGTGRGQVELGAPSGIYADAHNGILMGSGVIKLGVEPWNGFLAYSETLKVGWQPGLSAGFHYKIFYAGPRLVYQMANNSTIKQGFGVGSVVQLGPVSYWENPGLKIYSLNLKQFSIEQRNSETFFFVAEGF